MLLLPRPAFAGAQALTYPKTLAGAGAVRAMELDSPSRTVDFHSYQQHAGGGGLNTTELLPNTPNGSTRYLVPDQCDFVAVTFR